MNNLLKLSFKTLIYSFIFIFVLFSLFIWYFVLKWLKNEQSNIMFKAMYLTKKEKCNNLTLEDTTFLNKSFEKIGYSWWTDYWCDLKVINFFQSKVDWYNKLNGKQTFTGSINIPSQIGKLKNIYEITLVNVKIDWDIPIEIWELKKLVRLELVWTTVEKLPKEIENLEKLQILYIDKNLYEFLPKKIIEKIKNKEIITPSS